MLEEKEHYKMYKDGKRWVAAKISTVAGVALFSTMILGGGHVDHVSADSVSASQVSRVTSNASSVKKASVATRDTKQAQPMNLAATSSSKAAINVDVPHSGLDNAVANAKKDGVQVTQTATQNQNVPESQTNSAEQKISQDYQNQINNINNADVQQKKINSDNSHVGDQGDHSALDSAVANAKSKGLTVNQTSTQNIGADQDSSHWQDAENQISQDYSNQVNSINKAVSDYESAVAKANQENQEIDKENADAKADYDSAEAKYQQDEANYQKALAAYKKELQDNGISDFEGFQKNNAQYNPNGLDTSDIQNAFNLFDEPNADISVSGLNSNWVMVKAPVVSAPQGGGMIPDVRNIQNLPPEFDWLKTEDERLLSATDPQPIGDETLPMHHESDWHSKYIVLLAPKFNSDNNYDVTGNLCTVTWTNLNNQSNVNGKTISKITMTFSNLVAGKLWNDYGYNQEGCGYEIKTPILESASDITEGLFLQGKSLDVKMTCYDQNGNVIPMSDKDYMAFGSISHGSYYSNVLTPYHEEFIKGLDGDKMLALKGSVINVVDNVAEAGEKNMNTYLANSNDDPHTEGFYGDTAVLQGVNGSDSLDFQFGANNVGIGTEGGSIAKGQWLTPATIIPPTEPTPPKEPPVPTYKQHVSTPSAPTINYHYDQVANQKQANVQVAYHYDGLTSTPNEVKDVDAGDITGSKGTSVNGKDVVKGEDVTFPLSSAPLPANRTDDVKTLTFTDTLDNNVKYDGWKAVDAKGNDVSKDFTMSQNGQTITFTATQDFMNQINSNKGSQFDLPTIDIAATATASGVQINNTFQIHVNGNAWSSNKVTFSTPGTPKPVKTVDNAQGQSVDGGFVEPGQEVDFNLTFDLSGDKNVVLDKNTIAKGLSMSDNMDKRLTPNINGIKITDANGKEVNKDLFNITDNNNQVVISVKDPQAFLNTYGGQKLNIFLPAKVNEGITGNIPNTAKENHFGDDANTNQVIVYVPAPKKDVVAGTVQGTSSASINGEDVVAGQKVTFTLGTTPLPAGRKADIKNYSVTDELDPNFDYSGFRAFLGSKDVTDEFTPSLVKGQDGKWTLTLTANADMLKQMNADKSKAFTIPTFDIYGSAINSGVKIQNTYTEHINNESYNSNTVSITTTPKETPVKTVTNAAGQDADNGNVERGDSLIYHVSMDLDGMPSNMVLTPDTIQKGLWVSDKMPAGVTVNTSGIRVNSADGKDITSDFTITYQDGVVKVAAKDPASIIKQFGNIKLSITIPTTVNDNFTGDIKNTAIQNTFGNETESNTVVDHVPPMAPSKDVVVDLGNQNSLNGKSIALNSTFDYKLNSSTRPADYVGQTTEWGGKDMIDVKHDEFTGQWQVIANHPFVLKDGTTIKAGSDISKYFTMTFNDKTGEFDIEANKDFLDIMNLPANKKTAQGWSVFFQCKRIATGTAHNVWTETYNGKPVKSNTVTTTTPEPKKPATPAKPAPQPQKVVEKQAPVAPAKPAPAQPVLATPAPVKETPAPEKQAMPQTGESENDEGAIIGLAMLGAVGTMGLALKKKRFED